MTKRKRATHPGAWSADAHYGACGQSCGCCAFRVLVAEHPDPAAWARLGACEPCADDALAARAAALKRRRTRANPARKTGAPSA
jgi:hypothetical protein